MDLATVAANTQRFLDLSLRYVVAGGAAVLVFGALESPPFTFLRLNSGADVSSWLMLLYIAVIGPAIYAIHRAILHPFWLLVLYKTLQGQAHRVGVSVTSSELLRRTDERLVVWRKNGDAWMPTYDAWSAQIHFLYCSCWSLCFAFGLHQLLASVLAPRSLVVGGCIGLILFGAALISDRQLNARQLKRTLDEGG